tara:strand:+ start:130 stop:498 length:369 start_codon:yes stop_codon:yes gene_type:complete
MQTVDGNMHNSVLGMILRPQHLFFPEIFGGGAHLSPGSSTELGNIRHPQVRIFAFHDLPVLLTEQFVFLNRIRTRKKHIHVNKLLGLQRDSLEREQKKGGRRSWRELVVTCSSFARSSFQNA